MVWLAVLYATSREHLAKGECKTGCHVVCAHLQTCKRCKQLHINSAFRHLLVTDAEFCVQGYTLCWVPADFARQTNNQCILIIVYRVCKIPCHPCNCFADAHTELHQLYSLYCKSPKIDGLYMLTTDNWQVLKCCTKPSKALDMCPTKRQALQFRAWPLWRNGYIHGFNHMAISMASTICTYR